MDPSQVYSTGNLTNFTNQSNGVTSTWQNAGTIGEPLTCWSGGDPGYCGPNPRVAAWGMGSNVINFSYGMTDLYQMINVNNAVFNGTPLQVNGFRFSFLAKNGNGWDDGRQDYLSAYVKFYDNLNSKVIENYNYDLNRKYDWTYYNFNETFASPYALPTVGNAQIGFVGRDNNFWMGPYGPEITNVEFNVKYSVNPCAVNPFSSPSCAGFADALAKLAPAATTVATVAYAPPPPMEAPAGSLPPPPQSSTGGQLPPPPPGSLPPPPGAPVISAAPTATNPQPKVGEVASASGSKPTMSLSSIMSILSTESARVGNVEKAVVQQAATEAKSAAEKAVQESESVAGSLTSQSISTSLAIATSSISSTTNAVQQSKGGSLQAQPVSTSVVNASVVKAPQTEQSSSVSSTNNFAPSVQSFRPTQNDTVSSSVSYSLDMKQPQIQMYVPPAPSYTVEQKPQQAYVPPVAKFETASVYTINQPMYDLRGPNIIKPIEIEIPKSEGLKMGTQSPLNDYFENRSLVNMQQPAEQQRSSVNQKASDNDASAGGVSIAMIAKMPPGYELYSYGLKDAAFYAPKELYKNQNVVDNARALRQMSSDRLHQQMIDLQYKDN